MYQTYNWVSEKDSECLCSNTSLFSDIIYALNLMGPIGPHYLQYSYTFYYSWLICSFFSAFLYVFFQFPFMLLFILLFLSNYLNEKQILCLLEFFKKKCTISMNEIPLPHVQKHTHTRIHCYFRSWACKRFPLTQNTQRSCKQRLTTKLHNRTCNSVQFTERTLRMCYIHFGCFQVLHSGGVSKKF